MSRGVVFSHSGGAYDRSSQQDLIDSDPLHGPIVLLTGSTDAINPHVSGNYIVTTGGVDAMTITAPTAVVDDGLVIVITSGSANAHTLTGTGILQTGATGTGLLTYAAFAGASVTLRAYNAKWQMLSSNGITVTS
jgi:hypothetical protein